MFVKATEAAVALPLSRCTSAATPTVAQSWARRLYFRYDQPVESPSFGTLISVSSSPGPTAVSNTPVKKSAAATVRSPPGPTIDELGAEGEHHGGQVRGRVAVGERASDRAPVTNLRIADLAGGGGHDRAMLLEQRIPVHRGVLREGADRELGAAVTHIGEVGESTDVDELRRPRDSQLQRRDERVSAREHLCVGVAAEQVEGILDGLGHLVVERCGDHCFASSIARHTRSGVAGI